MFEEHKHLNTILQKQLSETYWVFIFNAKPAMFQDVLYPCTFGTSMDQDLDLIKIFEATYYSRAKGTS